MKTIRIGVPCACQNGHNATWWYRLEDLRWVDEGVKDGEKCKCPKAEFGQGYRRAEGSLILPEDFLCRYCGAKTNKDCICGPTPL